MALGSSSSGILGGTTQSGYGAYGTVPTVANPQATQASALSGNLSSLGSILNLTTGLDNAAATGYQTSLNTLIPGYSAANATAAANAQSDLSGVIGSDVMSLLNTQAAERGVSFDPNSANTNAAAMRAMGLTSEGLKTQGATELSNLVARNQTTQFNPASMLVTPGQQQEAQNAANVYASSPNPTTAAQANQAAASGGYKTGANSGGGYSMPSGGGYSAPVYSSGGGMGGSGGYTGGSGGSAGTSAASAGAIPTSDWTDEEIDAWLNQDYTSGDTGTSASGSGGSGGEYYDDAATPWDQNLSDYYDEFGGY